MDLFTQRRVQWLQRSLFLLFLLLCTLQSSTGAAEPVPTAISCPRINVHLALNLRTTLFGNVALLPLQADDPQLSATITRGFYDALDQIGKYRLLPPATAADPGHDASGKAAAADPQQQVLNFGRAVKARGVIHGTVRSARKKSLDSTTPADSGLFFSIKMTDTRTGTTAWSLSGTCRGGGSNRQLNPETARRLMEPPVDKLLRAMVDAGDIFSPLLPAPTVISTRGELRRTRIILQPDPPYTYAAYQLLGSETADGVFTVRSPAVANDTAPIVLEDTDLLDGKKYYYTVIGLTKSGLANIPAPPFTVTTSGAPTPLAALQASGSNLRSIRLFWAPSQDPNVTGYVLYRSRTATGPFEKIADITDREQQSYIDYGAGKKYTYGSLADDTQYFYTLRTRNRLDTESEATPVVSARTKGNPMPPTEIRAIERQPRKIPLFWAPGQDPDIRGYAILRSNTSSGPFAQIDFVRGRETQEYTDTGSWSTPLKDDFTYFYRLRSVNVLDMSSVESETVSAVTKAAPAPVRQLRTTDNLFRAVSLQWQANPENDIISYEIFRGETGDDLRRTATVAAPQTSYTDKGLRDGSTYWYQLRAVDADQLKSALTAPVTATTKPKPTAPSGLTIQRSEQGIILQWRPNPEQDIDHYEIYSMGFLGTEAGSSDSTRFVYTDELEPGSEYRFRIRAVNTDGMTGSFSQPVSIRIPQPVVVE